MERNAPEALWENGSLTVTLASSIKHRRDLDDIPDVVIRILREDRWQRFMTKSGKEIIYAKGEFAKYVETALPKGLGTSLQMLKNICRDKPEAIALIEKATAGKQGGDRKSEKIKVDNINLDHKVKGGTKAAYLLRRLMNSKPDLYQSVIDGEMSTHKAAIAAGIVKVPTIYEQVLKLIPKLSDQERQKLREIL